MTALFRSVLFRAAMLGIAVGCLHYGLTSLFG